MGYMSYLRVDVRPEGETEEQRKARHEQNDKMWLRINKELRRKGKLRNIGRDMIKMAICLIEKIIAAIITAVVGWVILKYM